jgi:hypothetical protein
MLAASAPALAATGKMETTHHRHAPAKVQYQEKSNAMRSGAYDGQTSDPYWQPCNYMSDYGDNACG